MRFISLLVGLALCLSSTAWAVDFVIDNKVNLALGTRTFAGVAVPDGLTRCGIRIARTNWDNPATKLRAWLETSVDGGTNWKPWIAVTGEGGPIPNDRFGNPANDVFVESDLPSGVSRRVRGGYELTGTRLRTTVLVRCF